MLYLPIITQHYRQILSVLLHKQRTCSRDNRVSVSNGKARGRVADRPMWIDANIDSFQRLLKPLSKKLVNPDASLLKEFGSKASGAEMGLLLGWMSGRVLANMIC